MLQIMAWVIWSRSTKPNNASGLSSDTAQGPCSIKLAGSQPDLANDGSSNVYSQTVNPAMRPASAPARVAPRQNMPPSIGGANCATAAKEISPIATKAY